jgi:hypothetical protein
MWLLNVGADVDVDVDVDVGICGVSSAIWPSDVN